MTLDNKKFTIAVRDPLWKHIYLTEALAAITETPEFSRLYRIRQLGPTELVYPGASHTRAAHSLGVYCLARKLLDALLERGADAWVSSEGAASFLAAALLHDAGHFPFAHSLKELPLEKHERLAARLIEQEPLKSLVGNTGADPYMAAAIIDADDQSASEETLFFRRLLSGVLDPDKLDYLNRDAFYCGVPYGRQDVDYIFSQVYPNKTRGIEIGSKGAVSLESVLFSKYLMYRTVYWHRGVRIATAVMKKALYGALCAGQIAAEELYGIDDAGLYDLLQKKAPDFFPLALSSMNKKAYTSACETQFDDSSDLHKRLENLDFRDSFEIELADNLNKIGVLCGAHDIIIDVPERITFERSLFNAKYETVFSDEVVAKFTGLPRVIRVLAPPLVAKNPRAVGVLAKAFDINYNMD